MEGEREGGSRKEGEEKQRDEKRESKSERPAVVSCWLAYTEAPDSLSVKS